jgi:hypothetical protein
MAQVFWSVGFETLEHDNACSQLSIEPQDLEIVSAEHQNSTLTINLLCYYSYR